MTTLNVTEARQQWSDIVDHVAHDGERYVLIRNKKHVAAIVSADDAALLDALEDRIDLEEALRRLNSGAEPVPFDDFAESLGL